jgi:ribosome maturation factor RimP
MDLKEKIGELITPSLESEGFELVEIKLSRFKRSSRLQIFVDSDNGVRIDDCARLSRIMEPIVDTADIFEYGYIMEVSSPGLDRPLHTIRDFKRRIGEQLRVTFNEIDMVAIKGKLVAADESGIELLVDGGTKRIALDTVKMGKIII